MTDRRTQKRFPLEVPVTFTLQSELGQHFEYSATSRDISMTSIFIHSTSLPLCGTTVQLEVQLRNQETGLKILLETTGKVVRIAKESEQMGFAIAFQHAVIFERDCLSSQIPEVLRCIYPELKCGPSANRRV
jgi:PilZ domain